MGIFRDVRAALPPLAWLLEIDGDPGRHRLICGSSVTLSNEAFFEGCWPGDYRAMDFAARPEAFGSGGILQADGWTIVTPSHTLEAVFCCRDGSKLFLSNALPFLLAHRGDSLDPEFSGYHRAFFDIAGGIEHSPIRIPSRRCSEIHGYFFDNLVIDPQLEVHVRPKPISPGFANFHDYRGYLVRVVEATLANAADPLRPAPYRPLSTISRGYDSATCTAIAREAGCQEAVTLAYARRAFGKIDPDSGEEIAKALGLAVTVLDRDAYLKRSELVTPEAEFISHGLEGTDVNYLAFEPILEHRVLFTGSHGDTMWDMHKAPCAALKRGDLSSGSLGEFRRRVDFFHVPLPYVGALRHADVAAISNSPELAPYSIGGDYDRPISRRILEEAGVPRNAFGMSKKATAITFFGFQPGLTERLTESTRRGLDAFARNWRLSLRTRLRLRRNALVEFLVAFTRLVEKKTHLVRIIGLEKQLEDLLHTLDIGSMDTPTTALALHWAMSVMIERYARAEAGASERGATAELSQPEPRALTVG